MQGPEVYVWTTLWERDLGADHLLLALSLRRHGESSHVICCPDWNAFKTQGG